MNDLIEQAGKIVQLAPPVAVMLVLVGIGWAVKQTPISNSFIPIILPFIGAFVYPFVAETGKVSYSVRYPEALNAIYGAAIGLGAVGANQLFRQMTKKDVPVPTAEIKTVKTEAGKTTITTEVQSPKPEPTPIKPIENDSP